MMRKFLSVLALISFVLLLACGKKEPAVEISNAWTRATQQGQDVGASYMTLKANTDLVLTSAESSITQDVEIHSMTMENGVMKMRMLDELPLKADTAVELAPGGVHLMLFDLEDQLSAGDKVTFTLHFKTLQGKELSATIDSPVKAD